MTTTKTKTKIIEDLKHRLATELDKDEPDHGIVTLCCDQLMSEGYYVYTPYMEARGDISIQEMVQTWGVDYPEWRDPLFCRHCDLDLRDNLAGPPFKLEVCVEHENGQIEKTICPQCEGEL